MSDIPSPHQQLGRAARRGAIWSILAQGTVAVCSVFSFALLGRTVSPAQYGEYIFAVVLLAGVQWLSLNAYKEPVIQAARLGDEEASSSFWFACGIGVLLALIMLAIAAYLFWASHRFELSACMAILSIKVLGDSIAAVPLAMRARALDFRFVSLNAACCGIVTAVTAITLLHLGFGIRAMAIGTAAGAVTLASGPLLLAQWRPAFHFAWRDLGVLKSYSPHVIVWQGVEMINACLDRFFVGTHLSVATLGLYGFARRLNEVVIEVLVGGVSNVALPSFAVVQDDKARLRSGFLRAMRAITFIVIPVIGLLFVSAEEVIQLVFGDRWLPAVATYRCFLLLGVIQTVGILQAALIRSLGQTAVWSRYMLLQTAGNIVVVLSFIQAGIFALALALVIKTYLIWGWSVVVSCRLLEMPVKNYLAILVKPLACSILAALAAYIALHLVGDPSMLTTIFLLSMAGACYLVLGRSLNRDGFTEVLSLLHRA